MEKNIIPSGRVNWPACEEEESYPQLSARSEKSAFEAEKIEESSVLATERTDVIICGLGISGFAAALSCAQRGLKTVVLEKSPKGVIHSMTVGGLHDRIHRMYGVEFDEEQWLSEAMTKNGYRANQALYRRLMENDEEAVNWWLDQLPFADEEYKLTFFGYSGTEFDFRDAYDETARDHSWNTSINIPFRTPNAMRDYLAERTKAAGAEIRFQTPAVQLIQEESGRVIGAYGKTEDGYIRFLADKGVVLATGGYGSNAEKLKESCRPRDLMLCAWMNISRSCTGDGHEMGCAVGGIEDEYPHPLMLDPMQLMSYVRVNSQGKRFIGEYETYDHLASAIQSQQGGYDFFLTDANAAEAVDLMWSPSSSCYAPKSKWISTATGSLQADSLEELAEKMGVPPENLKETVRRWNEMCAAKKDADFGYPGERMHPIDTPPYYATKEMAMALTTCGGLQIDEYSRVLNTKKQPIEGLYAIGDVSGSMISGTYPHSMNCLSHTRCVVFGYLIGKKLAEDRP